MGNYKVNRRQPGSEAQTPRIGKVSLSVQSIERSVEVWRDIVGLTVQTTNGRRALLGVNGGDPFIELIDEATQSLQRNAVGMFHLAIYVPTRSAAVAVVARAEAARWPHAEIDHIVSESVYLSDPDGNGIEIAYPTPSRGILNPAFPRASDKMFMDPDSGSELDGSSPLDYSSELRDLAREQFDAMLAPESVLGHIHLKVEDIQATAAFYAELPGFKVNVLWERAGYVDLTVGGSVLHTVAGNTWSAPYTHKAKGAAGLRSFSLVVSGDSELEQAAAALRARDHGFSMQGGRIETHDPSGNLLQIIAP